MKLHSVLSSSDELLGLSVIRVTKLITIIKKLMGRLRVYKFFAKSKIQNCLIASVFANETLVQGKKLVVLVAAA